MTVKLKALLIQKAVKKKFLAIL